MKFYKISGISQQYFKKYGDYSEHNAAKPWQRKFGNIKDPKNGSRPFLLFNDDKLAHIYWAVPSTTSINDGSKSFRERNAKFFIYYYVFKSKEEAKQSHLAVFEFLNLFPVTKKYLKEYTISFNDKGHYMWKKPNYKDAHAKSLLLQIINTNNFFENQLAIKPYSIYEKQP